MSIRKNMTFGGNGINKKLRLDIGQLKYVGMLQDALLSFYIYQPYAQKLQSTFINDQS